MAQSLTTGFLQKLTLFPYLIPDANHLPVLAQNTPPLPLFSYPNLKTTGLLLRARYLQVFSAGAPGLSYQVAADTFQTQPLDSQALALLDGRIDAWGETLDNAAASSSLRLTAQNNTAGPLNNVWANWAVEIDRPSIAEKLEYPDKFGPLSDAEQALAKSAGLLSQPRGVLPRSLDWLLLNEYRNHIAEVEVIAQTLPVSPSMGPVLFGQANRGANEILALAGLAVSPGSGADGLTVMIGIDDNDSFYTPEAYGLGSGKPVRCFIQALRTVKLQMTATAAVAAASLAAIVWHIRLTDEIRARLGSDQAAGVPQQVRDKVQTGVL